MKADEVPKYRMEDWRNAVHGMQKLQVSFEDLADRAVKMTQNGMSMSSGLRYGDIAQFLEEHVSRKEEVDAETDSYGRGENAFFFMKDSGKGSGISTRRRCPVPA